MGGVTSLMGLTGRYDFKGIKKLGAIGLFNVLAASPMGFVTRGPLGEVVFKLLEALTNYLANHGLIFINIMVDNYDVEQDAKAFIRVLEDALGQVSNSQQLSAEEMREIDEKVIKVFDEFAVFSKPSKLR